MWGAGKVYGLQARTSGSTGWKADSGNGGACLSRNWRPASRAAASNFDHAIDRDGHRLQAAGNRGAGAVCPRAENVPARGRRADLERCGGAAANPAAGNAGFGSRCALVWRNEERVDGRGGSSFLSSGTGGGLFVRAEAGDATGIEDALPVGADGSATDERSLAEECRAREPDGATAGTGSKEDSATEDYISRGSERGIRANSARG